MPSGPQKYSRTLLFGFFLESILITLPTKSREGKLRFENAALGPTPQKAQVRSGNVKWFKRARVAAVFLILLVFPAISAFSQTATVKRNSNVRKSASSSSAVSAGGETSTTGASSTSQPPGQGFDPGCTLPFDSIKQKHPIIDDSCTLDGTKRGGGNLSEAKVAENHAKNNFCLTDAPVDISYNDLLQLETARKDVHDPDLPNAAARSAKLTNVITVNGHTIGEGTLVRLVLHVMKAKYSDTKDEFPKSYGESVNCYRPSNEENDIHIILGQQTKADECLSVTAEMSPHFRPAKWTADSVNSVGEHPIRVTGQLFYDSSHVICQPGKQTPPKRASLWEIHPVCAFEVCALTDIAACKAAPESDWRPLDQFTP